MPSIDVDLNARAAERNLRTLAAAFDDVADAAADAEQDTERGSDRMERSLRDVAQEAGKAERAVSDIGDGARKATQDVEDIGDGVSGLDRVKGGAQELRQEMGANLGEAVSSFRGDLQDIGQVGQDTLGGLAATVAGIGGAGGLLGALGLAGAAAAWGAFTQGQEDARVKQEELNESAARFAQGFTEGVNGAISASSVFAEILAQSTDPAKYENAKTAAEEWGVSTTLAMRAIAGDSTAIAIVQDGMAGRTARATEMLAQQEEQTDANAGAAYDYADAVERGQQRLDALNGALTQGQQQSQEAARAMYDYAIEVGSATGATDDLGNRIVRLPDGKEIVIDANTRTAYEDIDAIERREIAAKTVKVRADTSDFDRSMADLQRRANAGQSIVVPIRGGKVWQ